jgi:replicative DNA helicase
MNQTIPFNENFEKAVIVGLLADPSLFPRVSLIIHEEDFFKQSHKEIFHVISSLDIDQIDSLAVQDRLQGKTKEYFDTLIKDSDSLLPSLSNILFYAEQIRGDSKLRAGIDLGREIIATCIEPNAIAGYTIQKLEDMFAKFLQNRLDTGSNISTSQAFDEFVDALGTKVDESFVRTGFFGIDMILHRLEGLIILAARPGTGKTALAVNIARNVAEQGRPVVFFSLEQTREQIFERILATEAEVSLEEVRTGAFLADIPTTEKILAAKDRLIPVLDLIHIDEEANIPTSHITSVSRQKRLEWGDIGLIIVDYLHILRLKEKSLVEALGDATKELRALGKELNCPVLLLSQLSRQNEGSQNTGEQKKRRRPELTDLRSSGEIEQTADVVIFLYRESYYDEGGHMPEEDIVEAIVRKNRSGRTATALLKWTPRFVRFRDLSE